MLPEYPNTNYQGYAVVSFDVNEMGELINIEAIESKCAISRNEDGSINPQGVCLLYTSPSPRD